ncbi:hypothetical protein E4U53_005209, partial [Claviceps sorghi]
AIIQDILIHLHHRRAILGRLQLRARLNQDVIHNPPTRLSSCRVTPTPSQPTTSRDKSSPLAQWHQA